MLLVGGHNDGKRVACGGVPPRNLSMIIDDKRPVTWFLNPKIINTVFETEIYELQHIWIDDIKIVFYKLKGMTDYQAIQKLIEGYHGISISDHK